MATENKRPIVSAEGFKKLLEELDHYKNVRRVEIAEQIKTAIAFGDLSENAEYDEAKNEQSRVEHHILELEDTIRNAQVIDESDITTDRVSVGSTVKVLNLADNKEEEYSIVGGPEANPLRRRISNESPVGAALLGHTVGDTVDIAAPNGVWSARILDIHL
jgi:transcription elongation factor GreA